MTLVDTVPMRKSESCLLTLSGSGYKAVNKAGERKEKKRKEKKRECEKKSGENSPKGSIPGGSSECSDGLMRNR